MIVTSLRIEGRCAGVSRARDGTVMMAKHGLALLALLTVVMMLPLGAWSQEHPQPARPTFRVSWAPLREGPPPMIQGSVRNDSPLRVTDVQLEIEGRDGDGRALGHTFGWVAGDIVPGGEASFVVEGISGAESYRIRVDAFDVVSGPPCPRTNGSTR